jgi:hypothetical protein
LAMREEALNFLVRQLADDSFCSSKKNGENG